MPYSYQCPPSFCYSTTWYMGLSWRGFAKMQSWWFKNRTVCWDYLMEMLLWLKLRKRWGGDRNLCWFSVLNFEGRKLWGYFLKISNVVCVIQVIPAKKLSSRNILELKIVYFCWCPRKYVFQWFFLCILGWTFNLSSYWNFFCSETLKTLKNEAHPFRVGGKQLVPDTHEGIQKNSPR